MLDLKRLEVEVIFGDSQSYLGNLSVQPTFIKRIKTSQASDSKLMKILDEVRTGKTLEFNVLDDKILRFGNRLFITNGPKIKRIIIDEAIVLLTLYIRVVQKCIMILVQFIGGVV